ncbi:MAG: hypothetical protein WKF30_11675 [Pyrinomonadaceae bacterium]
MLLMSAVIVGYFHLRGRHAQQIRSLRQSLQSPPQPTVAPAQVRVIENEPALKGSLAILNGTVQNISNVEISDLLIEFELISRRPQQQQQAQTTERRLLPVKPIKLRPSEAGKYHMEISSRQYSGARVVKLLIGDASSPDIPFEVEAGHKRPKELPIGQQQHRKRPGDNGGFLNSPDNPVGLP